MVKSKIIQKLKVPVRIIISLLLLIVYSCEKEKTDTNEKSNTDIFSDYYSSIYDQWELIGIAGGLGRTGVKPDFDLLVFNPEGKYEILKNEEILESGIVIKDSVHSTDDEFKAFFIPEEPVVNTETIPVSRVFNLQNDTLILSYSYVDTQYSFYFVRKSKAIAKTAKGFHLQTGNIVVMENSEIDFYDIASHQIFLKTENPLIREFKEGAILDVYADESFIYSILLATDKVSTVSLIGRPVIRSGSSYHPEYFIPITFIHNLFEGENEMDPRGDKRITEVLKENKQFRKGLSCSILTIDVKQANKVELNLVLNNTDSIDYCYLNPETMDTGNYHFYTTGLFIADIPNRKIYGNNVKPASGARQSNWLALIKSGESKSIRISYDNFDAIGSGQYKAIFRFPGLTVGKSMLIENNGIIWSGELYLTKDITIE